MTVLNELRPGLDEKLYENALVIELVEREAFVEQQRSFSVFYKGHFIGKLAPDLIVEKCVIVDLKVAESFCDTHTAQMLGYLDYGLGIGSAAQFQAHEARMEARCSFSQAAD